MKPFTLSDLAQSKCADRNRHLIDEPKKKPLKYRNTPTEYEGIKFDSIRECSRYKVLKFLLKRGEIAYLRLQVPYDLNEGGTHSFKYYADFVYTTKEGVEIVEDAKGFKTDVYKKKKRMMKKIYNIIIKET